MLAWSFSIILFLSLGNCARRVPPRTEQGCSINLNADLPDKNQPLILKKDERGNYELAIPIIKRRQGLVEVKKGEELVLACPGEGNFLKETRNNATISSCISNTDFAVGETVISTINAVCATRSKAEVRNTKNACGTGILYEIGFRVQGWHPMIKICHITNTSETLHTEHTLYGASIRGAERESNRPNFEVGNLQELYRSKNKPFDPQNYYNRNSQEELLESLLGKGEGRKYLGSGGKFLTKGHLSPDGDFIFGSWQFATYFYANTAPQWQSVNAGNWLTVEKDVRKLSHHVKANLTIVTGTYGVLELPDSRGNMKQISLLRETGQIPVPRYFWKIVRDNDDKKGVAIVTSNNPFADKVYPKNITFCEDICDENRWFKDKNVKEVNKGYTFCCAVSDFRRVVKEVPEMDVSGGVLSWL